MKKLALLGVLLLLVSGCATYTTPGGGVVLSELADAEINELMLIQPAATFPVSMSVARVQASGYQSYRVDSFGQGRYSVVTTREVEREDDFTRLQRLEKVRGIAPLNRMLLPARMDSIKALREAAARLRTDILMIYTFDTRFHVGAQRFEPLNVISLGFLKNKEVSVTTTASAAFFDVRTEYLYGLAESTARKSRNASVWSQSGVVDDLRIETERAAFEQVLPEIEQAWIQIVKEYAGGPEAQSDR